MKSGTHAGAHPLLLCTHLVIVELGAIITAIVLILMGVATVILVVILATVLCRRKKNRGKLYTTELQMFS